MAPTRAYGMHAATFSVCIARERSDGLRRLECVQPIQVIRSISTTLVAEVCLGLSSPPHR